jgi:hypothetical protein
MMLRPATEQQQPLRSGFVSLPRTRTRGVRIVISNKTKRTFMTSQLRSVLTALSLAALAGCGASGGGDSHSTVTVGGTVTGLVGTVILQNNAGDNTSIAQNGAFAFPTSLNDGAAYAVTILTQPLGPTCTVANGSGTAAADVTNVSVTCTIDASTAFLPISPVGVVDSPLYVISSKSPGDPPIHVAAKTVNTLALQSRYTLTARGKASTASPATLFYTTNNDPNGDHVWSLDLTGASTLVPKQLSNLTIPYQTYHVGPGVGDAPLQSCYTRVISKNLNDPTSAFLILAITDGSQLCANVKWVLIHSGDGPTTDPVSLPPLTVFASAVLPLYGPDGTLAGLVAVDSARNLNFYPDETFTNPKVLLTKVGYFTPEQEPHAGPISTVSTDPTYSFLIVQPTGSASQSAGVYRVDFSGSISGHLYDMVSANGTVVDSGNLYFANPTGTVSETVGRILADGTVQILSNISQPGASYPPILSGLSGDRLLFYQTTSTQSVIQTLPMDTMGSLQTIASYSGIPFVEGVVNGDLFVNFLDETNLQAGQIYYSTQIIDTAGNVVQPTMQSSYFVSVGAPVLQLRNITDPGLLGGGGVFRLDLTQSSSPAPVALNTAAGAPFTLPSGTTNVFFSQITPTMGAADNVSTATGTGPALVYDLTKQVVVPVSLPNQSVRFVTDGLTDTGPP